MSEIEIELSFRNRQRVRPIHLPLLRRIIRTVLEQDFSESCQAASGCEVAVYLVAAAEMARLNEEHLEHDGPTDVITFDYSEPVDAPQSDRPLHGDIFVCIDVAIDQAREFQTTWQSELVRYIVHGLLHLQGYDDLNPPARKIMKQQENRLMKNLERQFPLKNLSRGKSSRRPSSAF